jgi:hypothetical protein
VVRSELTLGAGGQHGGVRSRLPRSSRRRRPRSSARVLGARLRRGDSRPLTTGSGVRRQSPASAGVARGASRRRELPGSVPSPELPAVAGAARSPQLPGASESSSTDHRTEHRAPGYPDSVSVVRLRAWIRRLTSPRGPDIVVLTTAPNEAIAGAICSLLASEGIEATQKSATGAFPYGGVGGERLIFVQAAEANRAKQLIETVRPI